MPPFQLSDSAEPADGETIVMADRTDAAVLEVSVEEKGVAVAPQDAPKVKFESIHPSRRAETLVFRTGNHLLLDFRETPFKHLLQFAFLEFYRHSI